MASAPAPPDLRTISPLILTLIFSVPSGCLQKIGPEYVLPSSHRRFDLCSCAPILILSSSPSSRCPHLGKSFSSLSFSPSLKFARFYAFAFYLAPRVCHTISSQRSHRCLPWRAGRRLADPTFSSSLVNAAEAIGDAWRSNLNTQTLGNKLSLGCCLGTWGNASVEVV